jgi:hypothetical protein
MHHYSAGIRLKKAAVIMLSLAGILAPVAQAKSKDKSKEKNSQQERSVGIYLIGHLPLPTTTVSRITSASDPTRQMLQLTDTVHGTLTVVDVGQPAQPKLLEQSHLPEVLAHAYVQVRMGDAALLTAPEGEPSTRGDPQSFTLVSFADPSHPTTVQKFEGVTAVWSDRERELIYLANADGLWILEVYSAADRRAEEQFDEMLWGARTGG